MKVAILFVVLSLISFASSIDVSPVQFNQQSEPKTLECSGSPLQVETSIALPQWTNEFVYPVEVCVSIEKSIKQCPASAPSIFSLISSLFGAKPLVEKESDDATLDLILSIQHKDAAPILLGSRVNYISGDTLFCNVFDLCTILNSFDGKDISIDEIKLSGIAQFINYGPASESVSVTTVIRGTGINVQSKDHKELVAKDLINHPYTAVCGDSIDCTVDASHTTLNKVSQQLIYRDSGSHPVCSESLSFGPYDGNSKVLHLTTFTIADIIVPTLPPTTTSTESTSSSSITEPSTSSSTESTSSSSITEPSTSSSTESTSSSSITEPSTSSSTESTSSSSITEPTTSSSTESTSSSSITEPSTSSSTESTSSSSITEPSTSSSTESTSSSSITEPSPTVSTSISSDTSIVSSGSDFGDNNVLSFRKLSSIQPGRHGLMFISPRSRVCAINGSTCKTDITITIENATEAEQTTNQPEDSSTSIISVCTAFVISLSFNILV